MDMTSTAHIFKSYDIRGLVDGELSEDLSYAIGRAYVVFLRSAGFGASKKIVVGRDMRPSSTPFCSALIRGITDEGVDVVDIGLATTPLFNFACTTNDEAVAGIMVTASHNPAEYNGFKMTLGSGVPVGGEDIQRIRALVEAGAFSETNKKGSIAEKDVLNDYYKTLFSLVPKESIRPMTLVLDAGNGMAKVTFPGLLEQLPVEVKYLYLEPDGTFPNHEANPLKTETLVDLQKKVLETGADLGIALDGDADRFGLVDEKGNIVAPSFVGALVGLEVLAEKPTSRMLYDLRSSRVVSEVWEAAGATTTKSKVGHSNIKKQMAREDAAFASELSLHLYYKSMTNQESTDLSLLYVLKMLSESDKTMSGHVRPLDKYAHSGEINFEVADKEAVMNRVRERFAPEAEEVLDLDGVWMRFGWGWLSVRASNTEPVLRLNLEAETKEIMEEKKKEIIACIEEERS
jgi:phosphomannomutase